LYASGASTLSKLNIGTDGKVLKVSSGALAWSTDTNIGNTDLTLSGTRALALNGNSLTFDGTTGDVVFNDNGNVTVGGDLTITGDDLFLNTNTLGAILVADGTNFNPVVLSGDASINVAGALTINYNAAQSASAANKGFLTAADWTTFNNKQAALGFTAENVANKSTVTTLGTSDTLYPTQNAVKTYTDNLALGFKWKNPVTIINVIADTATPVGSPVNLDAYIINTGGATGVWASFAAGDLVQYQTSAWVKVQSLIVGDRFGVSMKSVTAGSGSFSGKDDYIITIAGGSAGAFTYDTATAAAPANNDAMYVTDPQAYYHNVSFVYSTTLTQWVQLSAAVDYNFGNGLGVAGTAVSLGALTSDWSQTGAFDITTAGDINLNGGDLKTTGSSATLFNTNATTLNIGGAATTISLGAANATVTGGGALVINSGAATTLTIDSGTTGVLNLGTGNNAKTINIGTGTAGDSINIGTNNTTADTIAIGSALDALSLTSTGLNVTTLGALTGVASINTVTHSATAITFAGAGTLSSTGVNAITLDSGSTGAINVGTSANAKTITIGNGTGATSLVLNAGTGNIDIGTNAVARTINVGTGAAVVETINVGGTGANVIGIGNTQVGGSVAIGGAMTSGTIDIGNSSGAMTGTINIGGSTGAQTLNFGGGNTGVKIINIAGGTAANVVAIANAQTGGSVSIGANMTTGTISIGGTGAQTGTITIDGGTGAQTINVATGAGVKTVTLGSTNGASTLTLESGTGAMNIGTGAFAKTITIGNATGATRLNLNAGTGGYFLNTNIASQSNGKRTLCWDTTTFQLFRGNSATSCDTSSARYKHDIVDISTALGIDAVMALRPVSYAYNSDNEEGLGFIAEEVALVDDRLAVYNDGVIDGINSDRFIPILTKAIQEQQVLIGDISPKINADGSNNGLSTLVATIQAENAHDPVAIITAKITDGKQFLTNIIAARVTAIRGYFDEVFANKTHQKILCVGETDNETCITKNQLDNLLSGQNVAPAPSTPSVVTEPTSQSLPDATTSTATDTPPTAPEVTVPAVVEPTPVPAEPTTAPELVPPPPAEQAEVIINQPNP
jgi:hypothetical protein